VEREVGNMSIDDTSYHSKIQARRRLSNASARRLTLYKLQFGAERQPNESAEVIVMPPSEDNLNRRKTKNLKIQKKRRSIVIRSIESADGPDVEVIMNDF